MIGVVAALLWGGMVGEINSFDSDDIAGVRMYLSRTQNCQNCTEEVISEIDKIYLSYSIGFYALASCMICSVILYAWMQQFTKAEETEVLSYSKGAEVIKKVKGGDDVMEPFFWTLGRFVLFIVTIGLIVGLTYSIYLFIYVNEFIQKARNPYFEDQEISLMRGRTGQVYQASWILSIIFVSLGIMCTELCKSDCNSRPQDDSKVQA